MVIRLLGQLVDRAIDRHLATCLLCASSDSIHAGICTPCQIDLPAIDHACVSCALPLQCVADHQCPRCLQKPPPQSRSRACWYYAYPVAQLIQRFKYRRDLAAGRTLAELAATQLDPGKDKPDLLVPVPLHWRKQLSRGYNQAGLIAHRLGHQWRIPVDIRALRKVVLTDSQQELRRRERLRNLSGSFAPHPRVAGLHIGLVDDVITTGATLEVAAQALLDAGAVRISTFALARVP